MLAAARYGEDKFVEVFETYLPHVRIVGLDGGIHDLEFQKPQEVADLVLDFSG